MLSLAYGCGDAHGGEVRDASKVGDIGLADSGDQSASCNSKAAQGIAKTSWLPVRILEPAARTCVERTADRSGNKDVSFCTRAGFLFSGYRGQNHLSARPDIAANFQKETGREARDHPKKPVSRCLTFEANSFCNPILLERGVGYPRSISGPFAGHLVKTDDQTARYGPPRFAHGMIAGSGDKGPL